LSPVTASPVASVTETGTTTRFEVTRTTSSSPATSSGGGVGVGRTRGGGGGWSVRMTTEGGDAEGARRGTTTGVGDGVGLAAGACARRWRVLRRVCAPAGARSTGASAPHSSSRPDALRTLSGKRNTSAPPEEIFDLRFKI
jgi:hypothetical protein